MSTRTFQKKETCPSCHGDREVEHFFPLEPGDDERLADVPSYRDCEFCGGTGEITKTITVNK